MATSKKEAFIEAATQTACTGLAAAAILVMAYAAEDVKEKKQQASQTAVTAIKR
jgi:hypothetical protein